jgi:hypothetical protein
VCRRQTHGHRRVFEAADFGAEYTPELQAREARLREEIERQQQ